MVRPRQSAAAADTEIQIHLRDQTWWSSPEVLLRMINMNSTRLIVLVQDIQCRSDQTRADVSASGHCMAVVRIRQLCGRD